MGKDFRGGHPKGKPVKFTGLWLYHIAIQTSFYFKSQFVFQSIFHYIVTFLKQGSQPTQKIKFPYISLISLTNSAEIP